MGNKPPHKQAKRRPTAKISVIIYLAIIYSRRPSGESLSRRTIFFAQFGQEKVLVSLGFPPFFLTWITISSISAVSPVSSIGKCSVNSAFPQKGQSSGRGFSDALFAKALPPSGRIGDLDISCGPLDDLGGGSKLVVFCRV